MFPCSSRARSGRPTTPFLYFTSHDDADLGKAVSEGRRREFGSFGWAPETVPDPQDPATFERSKLHWDEVASADHAAILDWYRRLIALRRQLPVLTDGLREQARTSYDEKQGWLVLERGPLTVAVNLGNQTVTLPAPAELLLLAASEADVAVADGAVVLPPDSVAVLKAGPAT